MQQYNFCNNMISLEVRDTQQKVKILRERKFQGNKTTFVRLRFLQKFMACSEVLTPQINWNPPSAKIFKTIPITRIYTHPLFPKLSVSTLTLVLKHFNLRQLNMISIFPSIQSFVIFFPFFPQFPDSKGKTKEELL